MREAKDRKRRERVAAGWTPEPRMVRTHLLELGLRNPLTCEEAWVPFKSIRDAVRRLSVVKKFYLLC